MLAACETSSLTETEKAPVPETTMAFSGTPKEVDRSQSVISFTGKSDVINHEGKFNDYTATITLDSSEPANLEKAKIAGEISIASVEVDAGGLQGHLMKDDFFSVESHPKATFTSSRIVHKEGNMYDITGDLTVKGVTKTVTITAEITDQYLKAHYDFPRQEFGIGNDTYGKKLLEPMVPVEVKLVFKSA
jgi:polyisoprenoid-binding protein YceI